MRRCGVLLSADLLKGLQSKPVHTWTSEELLGFLKKTAETEDFVSAFEVQRLSGHDIFYSNSTLLHEIQAWQKDPNTFEISNDALMDALLRNVGYSVKR